jgi:hypothetical protein
VGDQIGRTRQRLLIHPHPYTLQCVHRARLLWGELITEGIPVLAAGRVATTLRALPPLLDEVQVTLLNRARAATLSPSRQIQLHPYELASALFFHNGRSALDLLHLVRTLDHHPLFEPRPARTSATRRGPLTAPQRSCADSSSCCGAGVRWSSHDPRRRCVAVGSCRRWPVWWRRRR